MRCSERPCELFGELFATPFERELKLEGPFPAAMRVDVGLLPCAEKKCWFCETLRVVDAAAGRPLAEKLSRPGATGNRPEVKRAFWNCE